MENHPEVNTRVDLAKLFGNMGFKFGAEIGVCQGKFSRVFCWNIPNVKLYCIDTWEVDKNDPWDYGEAHSVHYERAKKILAPFDAILIKKKSMDAVKTFADNSLDFVYIDSNHTYEYTLQDITEWSKKVRSGGIISGHDYYNMKGFGVIRAVDEYMMANNITKGFITVEKPHSFWWVKP